MKWTTKQMAYAALSLAASFVLGFITLFALPEGGRITCASLLPVMLYSYIYGPKKGLVTALIFSLLRFVQEPFFLTPVQFFLDYTLAYTGLFVAGFFRKNIVPGIVLASAIVFASQFASGMVFYAEYAPAGQPVWLYSLIYNGPTTATECAICVIIVLIPPMARLIKKLKTKAESENKPCQDV